MNAAQAISLVGRVASSRPARFCSPTVSSSGPEDSARPLILSTLDARPFLTAAFLCLLTAPLCAEDIRIDLDRREEKRVKPRIDASGFSIRVELDGNLQRLGPTTVRMETQQKGRWLEPKLDAGRYLKTEFDANRPNEFRIESTLKFDLPAGERRFLQERDAVQKETQKRAGGKDAGALAKAKSQVMMEHIAAIR